MAIVDPTNPVNPLSVASGNLRRRRRVDRLMLGTSTAAAVLAVAILAILIFSVLGKGASQLSISFLTKDPAVGLSTVGGGIAYAIVGSALIVAVATAMALPMVVGSTQTGFAASFALAIIMVPLIARTTSEMLLLVPRELRDAAHALGVSRWRTIAGVVLPGALGGILTGTVLAVARAAGETAPMLLLSSNFGNSTTINVFGTALPNIPMIIFNDSESGVPSDHARAWGAALVLIVFILVGNLGARAMLARQRRKVRSL
ncbi:MAG: ABC transporter permease subunit [Solirubrobacteraceae bacterium]